MPLTTKKMGMRNPNPMASSLPRIAALSPPAENSRTTMPAANAPSSTSRPSVSASRTSSTMNSSDTRTGSWALDSRWRLRMATTRGGWARAASRTVATATAMNASRSARSAAAPSWSAGGPRPRWARTRRRCRSPRCRSRTGCRRHGRPGAWAPACRGPWWSGPGPPPRCPGPVPPSTRANAAARPMTSEMAHPVVASSQGPAPDPLEVQLVAGQEDQEGQSEIREPGDHAARRGPDRAHRDPSGSRARSG